MAGALVLSNHTKDNSICVSGRKEGLWLPTNVLPLCWVGPYHSSSNPQCPWHPSGLGQSKENGVGRLKPGHRSPRVAVVPANSRSCCIQGWPGLCWGHAPRVGKEAPPLPRAAGTCGAEWIALSLSCHRAVAFTEVRPRIWGPGRGVGDIWPLRGFVVLYELLNEVSPGVDCEDPGFREAHLPVGKNILQETGRVRALSEPA